MDRRNWLKGILSILGFGAITSVTWRTNEVAAANYLVDDHTVLMPMDSLSLTKVFKTAVNGSFYVGRVNTDPKIIDNQLQVYIQKKGDGLLPIPQPIDINIDGKPVYRGQISVLVTAKSYSIAAYNENNVQVFYIGNISKYDGLKALGGLAFIDRCPNIEVLRTTEPTKKIKIVDVAAYNPGGGVGGGHFIYDAEDTSSTDDGGSVIVTTGGARWKRRTEQLLPVHFGAEPGNKVDSTEPLRRYIAASKNKTVDFRGSFWRISGTLDLSEVASIIADNSCIFKVNPIGFRGDWVITIGNPYTSALNGRASRTVLMGTLVVDGLNRSAPLNGVYLKGHWLNIGHIRVSNFNGTGIRQEAVWDSTIDRLSVELCGNSVDFAYAQFGAGDTHNTTHIKSIQVEQSYNRAITMSGIRNVIDNIHCERTYITSLDDGTETTPSGLNYITCIFNLGNSIINQGVIDAYSGSMSPDGMLCVSSNPSVILSMDYSTMNNIAASGAVFSCAFGRQAEYNGFVAKDFYVLDPAQKIVLRSPRIQGTLFLCSEIIVENAEINKMTPCYNACNIMVSGGVVKTLDYKNKIKGLITFNNVTVLNEVLGLQAPLGSSESSSIGELYPPTVFNNCNLDTVIGCLGSRAIFNAGRIATVALDSLCAFEFYNVKIGTFGYSGNQAFITRGVQADTVHCWSEPRYFQYPAGTITERVGPTSIGKTGVIYVSRSSTIVDFGVLVST
ncbi:TPA: phage tailspike protein [Serratia fonticola]